MDNRRIPTPFYAVAGASDLAYRKLRELSERFSENMRTQDTGSQVRHRAEELRARAEELRTRAAERDLRAEMNRLVEQAQQKAHVAQQKATRYYHDLVVRGEQVVRGAEYTAADRATAVATELEADAAEPKPGEITTGTAATTPAKTTPKPVKRTRSAAPRKQTTA